MTRRGEINVIFYWLSIMGGFFICPISSFATTNNVVINEIAWMGTSSSTNDEWIELYNNTNQDIDLAGWALKAADGTPDVRLEGTIVANGYFLLERTDDTSVSNITADQVYAGALNNSGESLKLHDVENNLIDSVDCLEGWFAGDNSTKQTMERISSQNPGSDSNNWQNSQSAGGTPKAQNSNEQQVSSSDEQIDEDITGGGTTPSLPNRPPTAKAGTDITALVNQEISFDASQSSDPDNNILTFFWNFGDGATDTQEKTTHIYSYPGQYLVSLFVSDSEFSDLDIITVNIYSQSVIISEFLPNPEGEDEENEWIELYNQNDQIANLTGWQLDDQEGGSFPFTFPANSLIAPHQFLVLRRAITKIALNNDADQVRLIYPNGSVGAEISYLAEGKEGSCVAFGGQGYFWTKIPTPGTANIISSAKLKNQEENFSSNNPQPVIKQTQELPNTLAATTYLSQSQEFSTLNPPLNSNNNLQEQFRSWTPNRSPTPKPAPKPETPKSNLSQQSASLAQKTRSNQKANLILILSIIISASLLTSWLLTLIRKKSKIH
jgi:PKD repeat protein